MYFYYCTESSIGKGKIGERVKMACLAVPLYRAAQMPYERGIRLLWTVQPKAAPQMSSPQSLPLRTTRGRSAPLGATPLAEGINFVLLCRHGTSVALVIQAMDQNADLAEIPLDGRKNRT